MRGGGGVEAERKAVMLSYHFPPLVGVASERAAAAARYLPDFGWGAVVVAPAAGHFHRTDVPADASKPGGARVVRTRNPELSRLFRSLFRRAARGSTDRFAAGEGESETTRVDPVDTGPVGAMLRRAVRDVLYLPDAQVGWIPFAAAAARRELALSSGPTVLLSSSVPYSSHLAAWWARGRTGVPWIAELRDPWSHRNPHREVRGPVRRGVDARIERSVLLAADHVVVTSRTTRDLLLRDTPGLREDGISVVMNGFEPSPPGDPPEPDAPLRLVYGGTLYRAAHARPLLEALARLSGPVTPRLDVYGPPELWKEAAASVPGADAFLSLHGVVSPERVREELSRASALVLLAPERASATILPGKTFEYLGARRPILASVPDGSEMEELILEYGRLVAIGSLDAPGVATALEKLTRWHREGRLREPSVSRSRLLPLERRAQVGHLAGIFDRVAAVRSFPPGRASSSPMEPETRS